MSGGGNGGNGMISSINVTPLVDVMLVLLIIFIVTARLVVAPQTALGLQLPRASGGETVQVIFSIQLTREGGLFVDGRPVASPDDVGALAQAQLNAHPDLKAVIQADGEVPHRRVVEVMDRLARAQVTSIAFAVDREP